MLIQGQIGPVATTASISPGLQPTIRLGNLGDAVVSELHGRYYETTYRRAMYTAAVSSGVTTTVGTATTFVGLCLSNPISSPVNLVVNKYSWASNVVWAAVGWVGLMTGFNSGTNVTHTTAATVKANFVGVGAAGQGLVDSASTLPTAPTATFILAAVSTAAAPTAPGTFIDMEGSIILPPGAYCCSWTSGASGTAGFSASIQWEEVPV